MKPVALNRMFRKYKMLTLKQVAKEHDCSIRTIQRQFAELNLLRSYNKNSRYYTLPEIPTFNDDGIWCYQDILFSKYGDLKQTVRHAILSSENGLSGNEIGNIVQLLPRSFLHHFQDIEGVFREKHGGVYIYFSNDLTTYAMQKDNRVRATDIKKISDGVVIKILVAYIKHPDLPEEKLSYFLKKEHNLYVSPPMITSLFEFHGLEKKTPDFQP